MTSHTPLLTAGLGMTLCMAIMMLIIRQHRATPMLPAACLSALLFPLMVWPFAAPLDVSMPNLLKLFLFGTTQFGPGLVFLIVGSQMVHGERADQHAGNATRCCLGVGASVRFHQSPTSRAASSRALRFGDLHPRRDGQTPYARAA